MSFKIKKGVLTKYIPENDETEVIIPNGVKSIGYWAFMDCSSLQSVVIPNGVTNIDYGAFCNCSSLQSVIIPNSVISIGISAFGSCLNLQSVVIPDSVTSIGNMAFIYCSNLQSVIIPDSVISIGFCAFGETQWLENKRKENPFVIINKILIDGQTCKGDVIIPESVTSIGDIAFSSCSGLRSVVIPDSVTSIGDEAFYDCSSLQSVVIPESVTEIGKNAFKVGQTIILNHKNIEISIVLKSNWLKNSEEQQLSEFYLHPTFENFKNIKTVDYKIPLALLRFFGYGEEIYKNYIQENILKTAKYIIDTENYKLLDGIISSGFITHDNIDRIIEYAIDNQKTEMFVMLNNFKAENNWYSQENFDI